MRASQAAAALVKKLHLVDVDGGVVDHAAFDGYTSQLRALIWLPIAGTRRTRGMGSEPGVGSTT